MFPKKLVSGLIVILLSLNFAAYAIENEVDDLNFAHSCMNVDLEDISQDIVCKYFSTDNKKSFENTDSIKSCECKIEENQDSDCTKIYLCKKHLKVFETWKEILSTSETDVKKNKDNKAVFTENNNVYQNSNDTYKDFENIMLGILYKYCFVACNTSLEDGDISKSCGCKIWKNKDCGFVEIYLCKEHLPALETWGKRVLKNLGADANRDSNDETIAYDCGCVTTISSCCTDMYFCEKHFQDLEDWGKDMAVLASDTNEVASNETIGQGFS